MRLKNASAILWVVITAVAPTIAAEPATPALLVENIVPVDPVLGALPRQDVRIEHGRITAMGELPSDPDANTIDGSNRWLIPGLWDMHVHVTYDVALLDSMAKAFVDHGITRVRDTGGPVQALQQIATRWNAPTGDAPYLYYAGPLLDGNPVVYDGSVGPEVGVDVGTAAAERVAGLVAAGISFIKIYEMVSPEQFHALVQAARAHDLPIAAHIPLRMNVEVAATAVDSLEHLRNLELGCSNDRDQLLRERRKEMDQHEALAGMALRSRIHGQQRDQAIANEDASVCDALIARLRDTIQVPTLRLNAMTQHPPFAEADWEQALSFLPEDVAHAWREAPRQMDPVTYRAHGAWSLAMIARLHRAGVPIGAGTDTPIGWAVPGHSLHRELELLVTAGLSPRVALAAATTVPASFFGMDATLGRLQPDYEADALILTANPLEDIRNTRRITHVIRQGRLLRKPLTDARPRATH